MFLSVTLLILTGVMKTVSVAELFKVVGPGDPVEVHVDKDVVLPCSLQPNISAENMTVSWLKQNVTVHLYDQHTDRPEEQAESYRGRTDLFKEELKNGNISLKLSAAQSSDGATYSCLVVSSSGPQSAAVDLKVIGLSSTGVFAGWKIALISTSLSVGLLVLIVILAFVKRKKTKKITDVKGSDKTKGWYLKDYTKKFNTRLISDIPKYPTAQLEDCNLSDQLINDLKKSLKSKTSILVELDLSYNDLQGPRLEKLSVGLKRLNTLRLMSCNLSKDSCVIMQSILSENSCLKKLDLSYNDLQNSGVEKLWEGLKSPDCNLESLRLVGCRFWQQPCENLHLASLKELDLSYNYLQDSGVEKLCERLKRPQCKLETLRLASCGLGYQTCENFSLALQLGTFSLKELDLSYNDLKDLGVKKLCAGQEDPQCKLEKLRLAGCQLTEIGCIHLSSTLELQNSSLKELDLSYNNLYDSGMERICAGLKSSHCKLEILRLAGCLLTRKTCKEFSKLLQLEHSSVNELDLSYNNLKDTGVSMLCEALWSGCCNLETLRLVKCELSEKSCYNLKITLESNENSLKILDLSYNDLRDSGLKLICAGLMNKNCKLEKLNLTMCKIIGNSCFTLGSILNSEQNSLKELDLSNNDLEDTGLEKLCEGLKSENCKLETLSLLPSTYSTDSCATPEAVLNSDQNTLKDSGEEEFCERQKSGRCKLETLRLSGCMITKEGCSSLESTLRQKILSIKELDLSYNFPRAKELKKLSDLDLDIFRWNGGGENRINQGLKKYYCKLTLDPNTAHRLLCLSELNRKVEHLQNEQRYSDHEEKFDYWHQVLCRESLTGRCYWETEWSGEVDISVAYKSIGRKGDSFDFGFGGNEKSWSLICFNNSYPVRHSKNITILPPLPPPSSKRVGVYVDCPAGTLSFYRVSTDKDSHTLTHIHTLHTTFTEPLCAGFGLCSGSSVRLCQVD